MPGPAFDPNGAVRFDLKSGAASDARGSRLLLVPTAALESLEPAAVAHLGTEVGAACGSRVAARLGGDAGVRASTLELVVSHVAGELALAGVGAVHFERWGRAMVLVVNNPGVNSDVFLNSVLAAALGAASGREVATAPLGRDGAALRFFVGTPQGVVRARSLVSQGKSWGDVLAALQKGAA